MAGNLIEALERRELFSVTDLVIDPFTVRAAQEPRVSAVHQRQASASAAPSVSEIVVTKFSQQQPAQTWTDYSGFDPEL